MKKGLCVAALGIAWALGLGGLMAARAQQPLGTNPYAVSDAHIIAEGKKLYLMKGCYACHGINGTGTLAPDLTKTTLTVQMMFERISNGKEGTAMRPFKDMLTPDELWRIITYLRSLGRS